MELKWFSSLNIKYPFGALHRSAFDQHAHVSQYQILERERRMQLQERPQQLLDE